MKTGCQVKERGAEGCCEQRPDPGNCVVCGRCRRLVKRTTQGRGGQPFAPHVTALDLSSASQHVLVQRGKDQAIRGSACCVMILDYP